MFIEILWVISFRVTHLRTSSLEILALTLCTPGSPLLAPICFSAWTDCAEDITEQLLKSLSPSHTYKYAAPALIYCVLAWHREVSFITWQCLTSVGSTLQLEKWLWNAGCNILAYKEKEMEKPELPVCCIEHPSGSNPSSAAGRAIPWKNRLQDQGRKSCPPYQNLPSHSRNKFFLKISVSRGKLGWKIMFRPNCWICEQRRNTRWLHC